MSPEVTLAAGAQERLAPAPSQAFPCTLDGAKPLVTVKITALEATPDTVTTTFPVVAGIGTDVLMLVAVHPVTVAVVPLNLTVLPPCEDPKFVPVIVTGVPTGPLLTLRLEIAGDAPPPVTVKLTPLEATPDTVTATFPVVAPVGTEVLMLVAVQPVTVAAVPLNATVLPPCEAPKLVPVIVTGVPTAPLLTLRLEMTGDDGVTVKIAPLEATPDTVTTTFPVVAAIGTEVLMLVAVHVLTVAVVPLNLTVLVPCEDPKFVPVIVTGVPTAPLLTLRLEMVGDAVTVKLTPLEATPDTVTTTFPVVAPVGTEVLMLVAVHPVTAAVVPLNVTVLLPCATPKFVPVIVTGVPTAPLLTLRLEIAGDAVTVKLTPLEARADTVTATFPVVAPAGTDVLILVAVQLVTVAAVPLNATVLPPCEDPKFVPVIVTGVPTAPLLTLRLEMIGDAATVNVAVARALFARPLAMAMAFTVVVCVIEIGVMGLNKAEAVVGVLLSVV
jgi:hypothetical protein